MHLSLLNRSRDEEVTVTLVGVAGPAHRIIVTADDPFAQNTPESPGNVIPVGDKFEVNRSLVLPPHSHTSLVFG